MMISQEEFYAIDLEFAEQVSQGRGTAQRRNVLGHQTVHHLQLGRSLDFIFAENKIYLPLTRK